MAGHKSGFSCNLLGFNQYSILSYRIMYMYTDVMMAECDYVFVSGGMFSVWDNERDRKRLYDLVRKVPNNQQWKIFHEPNAKRFVQNCNHQELPSTFPVKLAVAGQSNRGAG